MDPPRRCLPHIPKTFVYFFAFLTVVSCLVMYKMGTVPTFYEPDSTGSASQTFGPTVTSPIRQKQIVPQQDESVVKQAVMNIQEIPNQNVSSNQTEREEFLVQFGPTNLPNPANQESLGQQVSVVLQRQSTAEAEYPRIHKTNSSRYTLPSSHGTGSKIHSDVKGDSIRHGSTISEESNTTVLNGGHELKLTQENPNIVQQYQGIMQKQPEIVHEYLRKLQESQHEMKMYADTRRKQLEFALEHSEGVLHENLGSMSQHHGHIQEQQGIDRLYPAPIKPDLGSVYSDVRQIQYGVNPNQPSFQQNYFGVLQDQIANVLGVRTSQVLQGPKINMINQANVVHQDSVHQQLQDPVCPGVLEGMTKGQWKQHPMTDSEDSEMDKFNKRVAEELEIPPSLQLPDGKCGGNVTMGIYRALCDPKGPTPCCYNGACVNRPTDDCTCTDCYDMRRPIHAEYATWIPENPSCKVKTFSPHEMCEVLENATVYFIGDSYVRHVFTAFLMAVEGDEIGGALRAETPPEIRNQCLGMYMFTEKTCRLWLNSHPAKICNGRAEMQLFGLVSTRQAEQIITTIAEFDNTPRSLVFLGLGLHNNFDALAIQSQILNPILARRLVNNITSPILLWATCHSPGLLKPPGFHQQTYRHVLEYNTKMKQYFAPWNVPIFDTFNLTAEVRSFDGSHYGLGLNRMKARLLMNYLYELHVNNML